MTDAERAEAVQALRVAVERIAAGAEVAGECELFDAEPPGGMSVKATGSDPFVVILSPTTKSRQGGGRMQCFRSPAEARRFALDLLRAADGAEGQS